jgi:hypothetical protein
MSGSCVRVVSRISSGLRGAIWRGQPCNEPPSLSGRRTLDECAIEDVGCAADVFLDRPRTFRIPPHPGARDRHFDGCPPLKIVRLRATTSLGAVAIASAGTRNGVACGWPSCYASSACGRWGDIRCVRPVTTIPPSLNLFVPPSETRRGRPREPRHVAEEEPGCGSPSETLRQ